MTRTDLATLLRGIEADRVVAERHAQRALALAAALDDYLAQTTFAASLHFFYAALESLAERSLKAFDQTIPRGERWHQELLELAALDVPEFRPALYSQASLVRLRKLLAFRHFFVHAYAAEWERSELERNARILDELLPDLGADLDRFVASLRAALEPPSEG